MLERVCLEGSRKQAKYAVHALAAITKDDGLKSLSVLYKVLSLEDSSSFLLICTLISVLMKVQFYQKVKKIKKQGFVLF